MSIDKIGLSQSSPGLDRTNRTGQPTDKTAAPGIPTPPSVGSRKNDVAVADHPAFHRVWTADQNRNIVARDIRAADKAIGKMETFIDKMKDQLGSIVKNYPPYPHDSSERAEFLRGYTALRKQIDQMTIPPVQDNTSVYLKKANPDLQLPVLKEGSPDGEISSAADQLQKAKEALAARRGQLEEIAAGVVSSRNNDVELAQFHTSAAQKLNSISVSESGAEQTSVELRHQINANPTITITGLPNRLLMSLG